MLKDLQLIKEIFVQDVEQGEEVAIPYDLNLQKQALSYQFYDPILNIVQQLISEEIRGQVSLKYNYLLQSMKNNKNAICNLDALWKESNGKSYEDNYSITHTKDDGNELQHLTQSNEMHNINIVNTYECYNLQSSQYITLENDPIKLKKQYTFLKKQRKLNSVDGFYDSMTRKRGNVNLNYAPENEIAQKRQAFLKFKCSFLAKHK